MGEERKLPQLLSAAVKNEQPFAFTAKINS